MKIDWIADDGTGRVGIKATAASYDAAPYLSMLSVDGMPINVTGDRFAVAAFLAFGRYCAGNVELAYPVSPTVAEAIQRHVLPAWIQVTPVEFEPKALPIGLGRLELVADEEPVTAPINDWGVPRRMQLQLRRSDVNAGTFASIDQYITASNAWVFAGPNATKYHQALPYLALAVLFAESWQIDTIVVPRTFEFSDKEFSALSELFGTCRLGLEYGS